MGLFPKLTPDEAMEVFRFLKKSGEPVLYRSQPAIWDMFNKGIKTFPAVKVHANTPVEPIGSYWGKLNNLPGLIAPGLDKTTRGVNRKTLMNFLDTIGTEKDEFLSGGSEDPFENMYGLAEGILHPKAKVARFNPDEWADFVKESARRSGVGFKLDDLDRIRTSVFGEPNGAQKISDIKQLPRMLSKDLLGQGYQAVQFPDTVARQPNLNQTVLLEPGNMVARWMTGAGRARRWADKEELIGGAGVLGAVLALEQGGGFK